MVIRSKKKINKGRIERTFLKLVSILLSLFLWFYVVNSEPQEIVKQMRIDFIAPTGLAVSKAETRQVSVKLKGARAFINDIIGRNEKIKIDLSKVPFKKGKDFQVHIGPNDIAVPFGVDVLEVIPHEITLGLDRKIKKYIPIRANLVGGLPSELRLVKKELLPKRILIEGPVELMRKTGLIRTVPIDISDLEGSGELKIALTELDEGIGYDRDQMIVFDYNVRAKTANMTLKNIPIRFLSSKKVTSASSRMVSIDVLAPDGVSIKESDVQVIADVPEGKKGRVRVKLRATLPEGVHLLQINPQSINVRVR
ncbi:hypothetical protein HBN50_08870 [Halobacteriovorax sp. GB3]|uniref:CdaR family protein n=1 Tax=Halobacteriovorax sp. GB3 TaxID=2719615 RepID=UPI00235E94BF|nr:CdaR family protein [Halobacteriovorax sp. GB3]MDD0853208.1 hypothetical protein [Halobacteriovorax sp. GB3]